MTASHVVLELTRMEAAHLADLVRQFADLIATTERDRDGSPADPAVARLVPDAYADDPDAAREFREITEAELLQRRADDAGVLLSAIGGETAAEVPPVEALAPLTVRLDPAQLGAWLRTLAALRLVLASRLGIRSEDDHDEDDPRFGIYDWLGYRLEGLVQAAGR